MPSVIHRVSHSSCCQHRPYLVCLECTCTGRCVRIINDHIAPSLHHITQKNRVQVGGISFVPSHFRNSTILYICDTPRSVELVTSGGWMVAVGIEWVGTSISLDFQMISGGLGGLIVE